MRDFFTAIAAILMPLFFCVELSADDDTRIMPLGDSITEAETGHAGYRYWLWNGLVGIGYEVDFVGSMYGVWNGPPLHSDFDQDHEGHWGWRADQIRERIAGWARMHEPNIVLVHLGHNDLFQGDDVENIIGDLNGIIGELRSITPDVTILLAQLIPSTKPWHADIPILNMAIAQLAVDADTAGSRVIAVDHWTGFDAFRDTYDGTHPNEAGERKMADAWFVTLDTIVNPIPLPPGPRSALRRLVPDRP